LAAKALGRFAPKLAMATAVEKAHLSRDPEVGEAYVNDPLVYLKGTTRFGRLLFAAMDSAREATSRITTPTLVVHGAEDELVPPRASATLARLASVERRVFPGLRHEMHNEPESTEVLGFISRWMKERLM
jgi:alpha-beta hydrolase superfamily lysophospholipase